MRRNLYLVFAGLILAVAAWNSGGVVNSAWTGCVAALSILACVYWLAEPVSRLAPSPGAVRFVALLATPCLVAVQLVPLPSTVVRLISPARAELADGLCLLRVQPAGSWFVPLSINSTATFHHLVRVLAYIVFFLLARELSWRFGRRRWAVILPLITVAVVEAALGLVQYSGGAIHATGTYVNPNHFAGILEMALPFALALAVSRFRSAMESLPQAIGFCFLSSCAAILFLGIVYSFSRMGLVAAVSSIMIVTALTASRRRSRWRVILPVLLFLLLLLLIPNRLLDRFSAAATPTGEVTTESRLQFWRETTHLIRDYPLFGCGLGTYVSAIQKYRTSEPLRLLDYAHNDYLQLLAELGFVGFLPGFALAALLLARTHRAALDTRLASKHRFLAIATAGSLTALAVHSLTDFNLYIPANAMAAAWIAGIAVAPVLPARAPAEAAVVSLV